VIVVSGDFEKIVSLGKVQSIMKNCIYISWSEKNDTGIKILDEQHRGIISLINSLHYSIVEKFSEDIYQPAIESILHYTSIHFQTEKLFLQKSNYPQLNEHLNLHNELIAQITSIKKCIYKESDASELLKLLKYWWLNHINVEDRKYIQHLSEFVNR
jgi:hemerythrin-like metal-binding protein